MRKDINFHVQQEAPEQWSAVLDGVNLMKWPMLTSPECSVLKGEGSCEEYAVESLCRALARTLLDSPQGVEKSDGWGEWMREQSIPLARAFRELEGMRLEISRLDQSKCIAMTAVYQALLQMRAAAIEQATTLLKDEAGWL